jgi:transposase
MALLVVPVRYLREGWMKGHLCMSQKERQRYLVLDRVVRSELRLSFAVKMLGISYRHGKRLLAGFRERGEAALVHGLRGREGTRRSDPAIKNKVIEVCREKYSDFGPTLASEKLAESDGLAVHPETLRLWLIEAGIWTATKRRSRHRRRRERRACFGELVQLDGSHHAWFEERGPKCCLITLVDDATGRTHLLFTEDEGTFAVMAGVQGWVKLYGAPQALYTDRLKTYLTDREPTVLEQLAGQEPQTQFGRACAELDIRIIAARSPQAKGRVERKHGLTQDRLVKELRLAGISTITAANKFVAKWLPGINERFSVAPADGADGHRPVPIGLDLDAIFCRHEERIVGNDWVLRYNNQFLQIVKQPDLPPSGSPVMVRQWEDGRLEIWFKNRRLRHETLAGRPERVKPVKLAPLPKAHTPPAEHPWRGAHKPGQDTNPRRDFVEQVAAHYLGDGLPSVARAGACNVTLGGEI